MTDFNSNWEERGQEEAEKVGLPYAKFEAIGAEVVGKYLSQEEETSTFHGSERKSVVYTFGDRNGQPIFKINPNSDLRKRLSTLKIGEVAKIVYVSDKPATTPGFSPMKIFKLLVAKSAPSTSATPPPAKAPAPF